MSLHQDFKDILAAFASYNVEYVIVGGYAVVFHGQPRFTKDLDLWINPSKNNMDKVRNALISFGAPEEMLIQLDSATEQDVLWMGASPLRIDIVKGVPGGEFQNVFARRISTILDGVCVSIISLEDLIDIKKASGRPQDLIDVDMLQKNITDPHTI